MQIPQWKLTAIPMMADARIACVNIRSQTTNTSMQLYTPQRQRGPIQEEPAIIRTNIIYDPPQRNATQYAEAISQLPSMSYIILAQKEREAIN